MRDVITALEAAVGELTDARGELPEDLRMEVDRIIDQARSVLASLRAKGATEDSDRADATG
jgi:hypothetical protein